jgi:hypothetical protein
VNAPTALLAATVAAAPRGTEPVALAAGLERLALEELHVTQGRLLPVGEGRLLIDGPRVRAVVRAADAGADGQVAELRFRYLGPSAVMLPLASGELRRQLGLKLRAEDGCNLVYVMWRIAPRERVVVSVKRNPGQRTSSECGARGYRNLRPRVWSPPPSLRPGADHVLRAEQRGSEVRVLIDGRAVWEGNLDRDALSLKGPVGLRADNGRFEVELLARRIR